MKKYQPVEIEIISFGSEDVIVTSNSCEETEEV